MSLQVLAYLRIREIAQPLIDELESLGISSRERGDRAVAIMKNERCDCAKAYQRILYQERAKRAARGLLERLL